MNRTGEIVREILQKTNISQQELCDKTGINKSAMSKYLSGDHTPRTEILIKISEALNVSLNTLLGEEEDETNTFTVCKTALLARSGNKLSEDEKKELINLILNK